MTAQTPPVVHEPLLIPVERLAEMLNLSTRTVWRMLAAGRIPEPVRIGGSVRWRLDLIRQWVDAGCPAPTGEK